MFTQKSHKKIHGFGQKETKPNLYSVKFEVFLIVLGQLQVHLPIL